MEPIGKHVDSLGLVIVTTNNSGRVVVEPIVTSTVSLFLMEKNMSDEHECEGLCMDHDSIPIPSTNEPVIKLRYFLTFVGGQFLCTTFRSLAAAFDAISGSAVHRGLSKQNEQAGRDLAKTLGVLENASK